MEELSKIISELSNHSGREGYGILYLVVLESWKQQPQTVRMAQLCTRAAQAAGKTDPKTVYRSLARAVDDLWESEKCRAAAARYFHRPLVEKPSPKDLVLALARHLWGTYGRFCPEESAVYRVFESVRSGRYGILACAGKPLRYVATSPFSSDRERVEQLAHSLQQNRVSLQQFRELVLAGSFLHLN